MSRQAVMNFIIKANQDKTLSDKVNALPSSRVEAVIDIAREAGFEFSADEFVATVLEHSSQSGEIQGNDLENIAGGAIYMNNAAQGSLNFSVPTDQFSMNFQKFVGK